eukprot:91715_1
MSMSPKMEGFGENLTNFSGANDLLMSDVIDDMDNGDIDGNADNNAVTAGGPGIYGDEHSMEENEMDESIGTNKKLMENDYAAPPTNEYDDDMLIGNYDDDADVIKGGETFGVDDDDNNDNNYKEPKDMN